MNGDPVGERVARLEAKVDRLCRSSERVERTVGDIRAQLAEWRGRVWGVRIAVTLAAIALAITGAEFVL